jgi:hypothetical protein
MVVRSRGELGCELGNDRDVTVPPSFLLRHVDHAAAHVLAAHAHHVRFALSGADQQLEREPRIGPRLMVLPVLLDLVIGPGMKAVALDGWRLHTGGRVDLE